MTVSVIPAYRVVTHLARRVIRQGDDDTLNTLESGVRDYVRAQLAHMHPSLIELGARSVVTQLGDPDLARFQEDLALLDSGRPGSIVGDALETASGVLPRPDLSARMFLFPGDRESHVLIDQLAGVLGFSLSASATLLFVWPEGEWRSALAYTVVHEYAHLVRNLLFPRGLAAGKLVYMKTQQPETLLDAMVTEGIADRFAQTCLPAAQPTWLGGVDSSEVERMWPRVRRRFNVSDANEIRRFLFGDGDRVPTWTGYAIGHAVVNRYLALNPAVSSAALVSMSASAVYDGSRIESDGFRYP